MRFLCFYSYYVDMKVEVSLLGFHNIPFAYIMYISIIIHIQQPLIFKVVMNFEI